MTGQKIRNTIQRRDFVSDNPSAREINSELDEVHKKTNEGQNVAWTRVTQDYTVSIYDHAIRCLRAGITLTLPRPREQDDGFKLLILDGSGGAAALNITILPAPGSGALIGGASSLAIATNRGFKLLAFDGKNGNWDIIG